VRANDLSPVPGSVHKKKRVGRGNSSGHGTYSGRGLKGQASRTGPDIRIGFEGGQIPLIRALSRKRGFNNRFRVEYEPINVGQLESLSPDEEITPESLRKLGIVKSARLPVKILGDGELTKKLTVQADRFSAAAKAKIEAAGGKVIELNPAPVEAKTEPEPAAEAEAPTPRRRARPAAEEPENEAPAASTADTAPDTKDEAEA
jgi:large subunit ribosomal protein L15